MADGYTVDDVLAALAATQARYEREAEFHNELNALLTPDSLDSAWAEAEAAFAENRVCRDFPFIRLDGPDDERYWAMIDCAKHGKHLSDSAPTPAAALRALAARLRADTSLDT